MTFAVLPTGEPGQTTSIEGRKGETAPLMHILCEYAFRGKETLCARGSRDKTRNVKKHPTIFALRYKGNDIRCSLPSPFSSLPFSPLFAQRSSLFHRPVASIKSTSEARRTPAIARFRKTRELWKL